MVNLVYIILFLSIVISDRITKLIALNKFNTEYIVNKYLSFELIFNRGISFGLFNSEYNYLFIFITTVIVLVTTIWAYHSYIRLKSGDIIVGEIAILAGSLSNILDRFIYGGVVDFIIFDFGYFIFPAFNIADASIVCGVLYIFYKTIIIQN